jgi:sugar lactone lactonase YvrE
VVGGCARSAPLPDRPAHRARTEAWTLPEPVGSLSRCRSGRLLLALRSRIARFDPRDGSLETIAAPEADRPHNRLNDDKASPFGGFVVGGVDDRPEKRPTAALWCLDPDGTVARLVEGMTVSNGLAWSPDGRMLWYSDSRRPGIWTADWDPATGVVGASRLVAAPDAKTGRPDGAAMDAEGGYWSAGVSAGVLNRWLPDGTLDRVVRLPLRAPTMRAVPPPPTSWRSPTRPRATPARRCGCCASTATKTPSSSSSSPAPAQKPSSISPTRPPTTSVRPAAPWW